MNSRRSWAARLFPAVAALSCLSCRPAPPRDLTLRIDMSPAEVDRALEAAGLDQRTGRGEIFWLGVDGPVMLHLQLPSGLVHVPTSSHGGIQLAGMRGDDLAHPPRLTDVVADVQPQPVSAKRASALAKSLCDAARAAGLRPTPVPPRLGANSFPATMCTLGDGKVDFAVEVDRFQLEQNGRFRVLVTMERTVSGPELPPSKAQGGSKPAR